MVGAHEDFEAFCEAAWPDLVVALFHHTGDRWLAEELAQEALIRAGNRWDRLSTYGSPIGWCYRVGANLGTSWFRRRRIERHAGDRLARFEDTVDDRHPAPDSYVGDAAAADALARLTPDQREVVVLRFVLGLDVAATATTTGRSRSAVSSLTQRALTTLRAELGRDLLPVDDRLAREGHCDG